MGAQEIAVVASTLLVTPLASLYSAARWDASRYVSIPISRAHDDQPQFKRKLDSIQPLLLSVSFAAVAALCSTAGYHARYIPGWSREMRRDAVIVFLMSILPVSRCFYAYQYRKDNDTAFFAHRPSLAITVDPSCLAPCTKCLVENSQEASNLYRLSGPDSGLIRRFVRFLFGS